jgi:dipeptidase D
MRQWSLRQFNAGTDRREDPMTFVSELEPKALWAHFDHILTIPRASKDEGRMREYVIAVAERNGLEYEVDAAGNTVVRKPAAPGREDEPATILQAHLDMVQEKNSGVAFDFESDAIEPVVDGEYMKANGTTLGSDNGIGVAAMLAIEEDPDLSHGPLELLFTVDEETGLTGAAALEPGLLQGRRLLNLDSEEEGVITIGCAGGADSHLFLPIGEEPAPEGAKAVAIKASGLKGGHSGVDIHLQRGNAIKLLARALHAASLEQPFRLASFAGGNAHNAIPREATATVVLTGDDAAARFKALVEAEAAAIRKEFQPADPGLTFDIADSDPVESVMDEDSTMRALGFITSLPHGVMSMSYDIAGLVETSTNLATATPKDGGLDILLSNRSSVDSALAALRMRLRAAASLVGAEVTEGDGYPGWQPDVSSPILGIVKGVYTEMIGEPEVGAVHAGLECGIIGEKIEGMDMISFGPQIEFPHSPDERVHVASVEKFYSVLCTVLERLR